jgi:hypothetical protein
VQEADDVGNWAAALEGHPALLNLRVQAPEAEAAAPEAEAQQAAAWASLPLGACPRLSHVDLGSCPLGALDAVLRQLARCAQLCAVHVTAGRQPGQQRQAWVSRAAGALAGWSGSRASSLQLLLPYFLAPLPSYSQPASCWAPHCSEAAAQWRRRPSRPL